MSNYIDVRVFPTSGRSTDDSNDIDWGTSLITEYNLASIINTIIDPDINGFVITTNPESGEPFKFNIKGYYFEIDSLNNLTSINNGTNLSASPIAEYVKFTRNNNIITAHIDIASSSNGLSSYNYLVSTKDANWESTNSLDILDCSTPSLVTIPQNSLVKFKTNSNYRSISIDDGDLDS